MVNPISLRCLLGLQLVVGLAALGVMPRLAHATAELDRRYAMETIGMLRSWDNVDGLFADYVSAAYREYFAHQSRFRYQDLSKADAALSSSKIPYAKTIEDKEILGQLARSMRTQSLIRTKIFKEGPSYRFSIEWLHSPEMDVLASETFHLQDGGAANGNHGEGSASLDFSGLGDIKGSIKSALDRLFAKVPFLGQVTGRDNNQVTLNLGTSSGIHKGDTLALGTIDEVKKHPLLKQIVEWRLTPTGKVEVDSVDDALAFGHVVEEEDGRQINRFQKVTRIFPKPENDAPTAVVEKENSKPSLEDTPTLGFVMASLWTGGYSRQYSSQSAAVSYSGGGFLYGARASGELWLNRDFFADLQMGYGAFSFSQTDSTGTATPAGSVGGNATTLTFDMGYTYYLTGEFLGPRAWIKGGYKSDSYSLPVSATEFTSPMSIKSVFLGLGGDMPIRDNYGARIDLSFGLFNSASETGGVDGSASGVHNASIFVSGYYRYKPRLIFQLGLEMQADGADFSSGSSWPQKTIGIMPSVQYLF